ncbi:MAG TPA: AAA domain-containing protein [Sedimentisphaerales bacterium]|jgi:very-short-patch-repair endonuclease|nr:AAA domain-containing protein [Sedimentisphaerales bacterium]HNU30732.1 AAA domain-containing protein [Sedimentisphaerales bacterium]
MLSAELESSIRIETHQDHKKAVHLVEYLLRLASLRAKLIRDIADYEKVLWISDIPRQKGCFTQAWGRDEEYDSDVWIEVQNRREPELPSIPGECKNWIDRETLRNKDEIPELPAEITRVVENPAWEEGSDQPQSVQSTQRLNAHPEIQRTWDHYVEERWLPWAEQHKIWESIHGVYSSLFAIHQEQLRLGEEYELVLGLGLLTWRTPTGQRIHRHLIVANALLEFEARLGKFTVRPSTDGASLRPELDMLDIEEQPARAEETAKPALVPATDDPWEKDCIEGVLKALVHSIKPEGEYDDTLSEKSTQATPKPIVEYAPALILRKRSSRGLTETLKRIKEKIEEGEDIPAEFRDLAEIGRGNDGHHADDPGDTSSTFDGEVFFPKPSNEDQRRIVDALRGASGVLVQGPPGTGKSHTIANLVCHLLATGQRTLITAKTPRALQVLEELLPKELRPLCINLLGTGLEEKRSLESSVGGILRKNEKWNERRAAEERKHLESKLRELREDKAQVDRRLRDIRESETHTQSVAEGAYRGTAARIAEAVNRDRDNYDWFTDAVPLDTPCPLSDNNLQSVLAGLRHCTPEKRQELSLAWPEALPTPEQFTGLVDSEKRAHEQEARWTAGANEHIADQLSTLDEADIERIHDCLSVFQQERRRLLALPQPWLPEAVRNVSSGDSSLWRDLSASHVSEADLRAVLADLRRFTPERREQLQLSWPDDLPSPDAAVRLFEREAGAAAEEELCLKQGAEDHIADRLMSTRPVCGSCRRTLECERNGDSPTQTEQLVTCPHCGMRNRVLPYATHDRIQTLHDALAAFHGNHQRLLTIIFPWIRDAIRDVINSNPFLWQTRCHATRDILVSIDSLVPVADATTVAFPDSTDVRVLLDDACALKQHMENGGTLGWRPFRPKTIRTRIHTLKTVRVNGHLCSSLEQLSVLCDVLRVRLECERAWEFWAGISEKTLGPYALQLHALKTLSDVVEDVLSLEALMEKCRALIRPWSTIGEPVWSDVSQIDRLIASCRLTMARQRRAVAANDLRRLEASVALCAHTPNAHPVAGQLLQALRDRDKDVTERCMYTMQRLEEERQSAKRVDLQVGEIAHCAPRLAKELRCTHSDSAWDSRVGCIGDRVVEEVLSLESLIKSGTGVLSLAPGMSAPIWNDEHQIEEYIASCSLALAHRHTRLVTEHIRSIETAVSSVIARHKAHPVASELLQAIHARDTDAFTQSLNKVHDLEMDRQRAQKLDAHISHLACLLPQLTDELNRTCDDARWDTRIRNIHAAWHWAQARFWVEEYMRKEDTPSLAKRVKQIEDEINATIATLASLHAWSFCFSRLTENHRRHMEAWQQSMRHLGKGTGKHAPKHRREAQQHLNECREAVPAWVMPLHRVWDTVDPTSGMFDLIIVDEASQCGFEALPLFYLGKKILIVGDDKQISPEEGFVEKNAVFQLMSQFLDDFEFKDSFHRDASLFDHGRLRYGTRRITLREHFRCMPEIVRFSNDLCYSDTPLIPLRQYGPERLTPLEHVFIADGYCEGTASRVINRPEAGAVVTKIVGLCQDPRYANMSMGVIVLQGEAQAGLIEDELLKELGAEEMERRRLICGNPYSFQGDERDIMFLSMVAAPNKAIGTLTKAADERRFNVAASRARDQMWLFHSVTANDLSASCLRRRLLEFFENTTPQEIAGIEREELERRAAQDNRVVVKPPQPFDSWFEVDVTLELLRKGFVVNPQFEVAGKRIDLIVEGGQARLAVECDGDAWHGADRYEEDMQRQRILERCGWEFFRVRESAFYSNKQTALESLWRVLDERGINSFVKPQELESHATVHSDKSVGGCEDTGNIDGKEAATSNGDTERTLKVCVGSTVVYSTEDDGRMFQASITADQSNPDWDTVNINTPIAKSLLGQEVGHVVLAHLPVGTVRLRIVEIR